MTKAADHSFLNQVYYQHGLFAFLLCFFPLIPGFTELHVNTYLSLFSTPNQNLDSLESAIKLVFGQKGVKAFHQYRQTHPACLLPDAALNLAFQQHQPQAALKIISRMFFDKQQRTFPLSDLYRAVIINNLPNIFSVYRQDDHQTFRSQLIQKTASLIAIEQALPPKTAALKTSLTLLNSTSLTEKSRKQHRLNAQLESLAARIKAELAGHATATTIDYDSFIQTPDLPTHLLTPADVTALKDIVYYLAHSAAPEIEAEALNVLSHLDNLDLNLT